MAKKTVWICVILVGIYVMGLSLGGVFQANVREQSQMHEYLKNGVSAYGEGFIDGTKAVFFDNIIELLIMLVSAYLPFGVWAVGGVLAVRGFMTGFALTAMLRSYGPAGAVLCIGNILSATAVVPLYTFYGIWVSRSGERGIRLGILSFIFLTGVLGADCVLKGGLSAVIMRLWQ